MKNLNEVLKIERKYDVQIDQFEGVLAVGFNDAVNQIEKFEMDEEKLAVELWSVLDPLGITKWNTLTNEQRDFYRGRARHLINSADQWIVKRS